MAGLGEEARMLKGREHTWNAHWGAWQGCGLGVCEQYSAYVIWWQKKSGCKVVRQRVKILSQPLYPALAQRVLT